jgi:hypothetical protein
MIAMLVSLHREVVLGFYIHGILQNPFKHRGRGGDDDGRKHNEDPHENPGRPIISVAIYHEEHAYDNKTNHGYRAIFYRPQSFHGVV